MPSHAKIIKGKIGEFYTQMELAKIGIDSISIDKTYDLFLWERGHRVEVKTSTLRTPKKKHGKVLKNAQRYYEFQFYPFQYAREAFDYAVCIGLDDALNVDVAYIIPHKALENQRTLCITKTFSSRKGYNNKSSKGISCSDNYERYAICRNNWNVFNIFNKSYFTRVKNQITNKILNLNENKLTTLKKEFEKVYKGPIPKHKKVSYLANKLNISRTTVSRYAKKWKLKGGDKH